MAIKDKDGKVYKLRGPNPLMGDQKAWDNKHVKFVNFGWEEHTMEDENNPIKKFDSDYKVRDIGTVLNLTPNIVEEPEQKEPEVAVEPEKVVEEIKEPVPEPAPVPPPAPLPSMDKSVAAALEKHKTVFHCAPAIQVTIKDDLYGDSYQRTSYGNKMTFEGIVTKQSDFTLEFWATKEVTVNSVVYPQDTSKRWWRIKAVHPKSGGYLMTAMISDVNPDFS